MTRRQSIDTSIPLPIPEALWAADDRAFMGVVETTIESIRTMERAAAHWSAASDSVHSKHKEHAMREKHPTHTPATPCLHEADWEAPVVEEHWATDGCIVTVRCRHCGEDATVQLYPAHFRWDDTLRRLDEDLALPPPPDPEREALEERRREVHELWAGPHGDGDDAEDDDEEVH